MPILCHHARLWRLPDWAVERLTEPLLICNQALFRRIPRVRDDAISPLIQYVSTLPLALQAHVISGLPNDIFLRLLRKDVGIRAMSNDVNVPSTRKSAPLRLAAIMSPGAWHRQETRSRLRAILKRHGLFRITEAGFPLMGDTDRAWELTHRYALQRLITARDMTQFIRDNMGSKHILCRQWLNLPCVNDTHIELLMRHGMKLEYIYVHASSELMRRCAPEYYATYVPRQIQTREELIDVTYTMGEVVPLTRINPALITLRMLGALSMHDRFRTCDLRDIVQHAQIIDHTIITHQHISREAHAHLAQGNHDLVLQWIGLWKARIASVGTLYKLHSRALKYQRMVWFEQMYNNDTWREGPPTLREWHLYKTQKRNTGHMRDT